MFHHIRRMLLPAVCFAGLAALTGCGVSQKTIDSYEARLKALEEKGTPDSVLSTARVYLMQAKGGKRTGGTIVKASIDSVKRNIAAAETWYETTLQTAKPRVDSLVAYFNAKKASLSGLQLEAADSLFSIVTSFTAKSWYIQAREYAEKLDILLPQLLKDEANAKKAASQIVGTWTMNRKHKTENSNAVEMKKATFKKDGTFAMDESMKGQTSGSLREDWQFKTSGAYTIKGDTILLSVQHEQCVRETYWNYMNKNGKMTWVKNEKKPYVKDIKDGSKDQFITFETLKEDFKK